MLKCSQPHQQRPRAGLRTYRNEVNKLFQGSGSCYRAHLQMAPNPRMPAQTHTRSEECTEVKCSPSCAAADRQAVKDNQSADCAWFAHALCYFPADQKAEPARLLCDPAAHYATRCGCSRRKRQADCSAVHRRGQLQAKRGSQATGTVFLLPQCFVRGRLLCACAGRTLKVSAEEGVEQKIRAMTMAQSDSILLRDCLQGELPWQVSGCCSRALKLAI